MGRGGRSEPFRRGRGALAAVAVAAAGALAGIAVAAAPVSATDSATFNAVGYSCWTTSTDGSCGGTAVTIAAGQSVGWSNATNICHTVQVKDGSGSVVDQFPTSSSPSCAAEPFPSSGSFSHSFTLTQPGTYSFMCQIHPSMHGTITVTAAGGTTTSQSSTGSGGSTSTGATMTAPPTTTTGGGSTTTGGGSSAQQPPTTASPHRATAHKRKHRRHRKRHPHRHRRHGGRR